MPNWSDPSENVMDAGVFAKFCLVLLGLSTWEIVNQLPFDWSIITRQRDVRWPCIVYFYCKYSLWLGLIGVNIALNITSEVNCQALYVFNQFFGNTAIASASTLLMLRTIAIWTRAPVIMWPLIVASLGQWAILLHGVATVRSSWSPLAGACVVTGTTPVFLELIYLYTMSFDFIVLTLSVVGLFQNRARSSLWQLLFKQGIVYFLVAFASNLIAAVFLLLNLNPIMNIMFTIPAATASSIVACRSYVSLTAFKSKDLYVHTTRPFIATSGNTRVGLDGPMQFTGAAGGDGPSKKNGGTLGRMAFRGMTSSGGTTNMISMDEYDTSASTAYGTQDKHNEVHGSKSSGLISTPSTAHGGGSKHGHGDDVIDLQRVDIVRDGEKEKISFIPDV